MYGISGDSLNGITDSIGEHERDISWVHVRHEESAAFAAGSEARVKMHSDVTFATSWWSWLMRFFVMVR